MSDGPRKRIDMAARPPSTRVRTRSDLAHDPVLAAVNPSEETASPSGRIRRDPRGTAPSGSVGPTGRVRALGTASASSGGVADSRVQNRVVRVIEEPAYVVLAVLSGAMGRLSNLDKAALEAARLLADHGGGAVVASVGEACSREVGDAGADRWVELQAFESMPDSASVQLEIVWRSFQARYAVLPDDLEGRDLGARLAARLGTTFGPGVHTLNATVAIRSAQHGDCDLAQAPPGVMTILEGAARAVGPDQYEARPVVVSFPPAAAQTRMEDLGTVFLPADDIPLEEASLVMGGGAGVSDWAGFTSAASALNAARAGTRVVCDLGFIPRDRQVGASGRITSARCYLAFGISGALQHMQGVEACEKVVAINSDPHAPILKRADLAIIADANLVLAALDRRAGGQ